MKVTRIVKNTEQIAVCSNCGKPLKNAYVMDNDDVLGVECMKSVMGYDKAQINRVKKEVPEYYKCKLHKYNDNYYIIKDGIASSKLSKGRIENNMGAYIDGEYIFLKPFMYFEATTFKDGLAQYKIDNRREWTEKHFNI